jgi:hypothetical protein
MANYGIFGHGSNGSWFSDKLNDFHDSTKKYDPISHYSVEYPMKGAHWLVEKSSGGLADAGIGEGWNTRLNQEADENGDNFGIGSQRMGVGIGSVIGAMYGYGAATAGEAGAGSGAAAGGSGEGLGAIGYGTEGMSAYTMPGTGGESVGGYSAMQGFNPNGLPEGSQYAQDIPTNNSWWKNQTGSGVNSPQQGGQQGAQGQHAKQKFQSPNMGNPALAAALAKLVSAQQTEKRKQEGGPLAGAVGEPNQAYSFGLTPEELQRVMATYSQKQNQYQDPYGDEYAGTY